MLGATKVILHILGLAMFIPHSGSPDITEATAKARQRIAASSPSITVVFPNVPGHPHEGGMSERANINSIDAPDWMAAVDETHTALIAFNGQYSVQGWTVQDLWTSKAGLKWKYIQLAGEKLSLQTGVDGPLSTTTPLALPHVQTTAATALADGYSPPYSKAAAVLDVREGDVTPCYQTVDDMKVSGRVDTEITLSTNGQLTISGGPGKSLTLTFAGTPPPVYLANVPMEYASHIASASYRNDHYKAYCAMLNGHGCSIPAFARNDPQPAIKCGGNDMRTTDPNQRAVIDTPPAFACLLSFECSNTQWP